MRETSMLYKSLRTETGSYYDVELIRGGVTYSIDTLKSIEISQALYADEGPQIGRTNSSQCKVELFEKAENWPRMASFSIRIRLSSYDGERKSEWLPMGTYYTDERKEGKNGTLSIVAYDGMLLLEQSWTDKVSEEHLPSTWPITGYMACTLLSEATGCVFENQFEIDNTVPFIGLNTKSTAREVLNAIAAGNGGNWQMTASGSLRFVSMANGAHIPAIAGIAVAGFSVAGLTEVGEERGNVGKTYVGTSIRELSFSPELEEITGVELTTVAGTVARAGEETGYVLKAECEFSDSRIANVCLNNVSGFRYKPFEGKVALMDPAAEVGDLAMISNDYYQMITIVWRVSTRVTADMSAPYEEEVDHEFKIDSPAAKTLRKALEEQEKLEARVYSSIEQTERSIITQVGETYETVANAESRYVTVQSTLEQTKEALDFEIQTTNDNLDELKIHYRFDENGETIGRTDSEKSIRVANDGIDMMVNNESVTHFSQDELYAPRKVTIPLGGTLRLGDFIFQPRSSGNMSLLWVGE